MTKFAQDWRIAVRRFVKLKVAGRGAIKKMLITQQSFEQLVRQLIWGIQNGQDECD